MYMGCDTARATPSTTVGRRGVCEAEPGRLPRDKRDVECPIFQQDAKHPLLMEQGTCKVLLPA
jgi:hypothetical protein